MQQNTTSPTLPEEEAETFPRLGTACDQGCLAVCRSGRRGMDGSGAGIWSFPV